MCLGDSFGVFIGAGAAAAFEVEGDKDKVLIVRFNNRRDDSAWTVRAVGDQWFGDGFNDLESGGNGDTTAVVHHDERPILAEVFINPITDIGLGGFEPLLVEDGIGIQCVDHPFEGLWVFEWGGEEDIGAHDAQAIGGVWGDGIVDGFAWVVAWECGGEGLCFEDIASDGEVFDNDGDGAVVLEDGQGGTVDAGFVAWCVVCGEEVEAGVGVGDFLGCDRV